MLGSSTQLQLLRWRVRLRQGRPSIIRWYPLTRAKYEGPVRPQGLGRANVYDSAGAANFPCAAPEKEDVPDLLHSPNQRYVDWYNREMRYPEQARCLGAEWLPASWRASAFGYRQNPYEQQAEERAAAQPFGVRKPPFGRNPLLSGVPWIAPDLPGRNDA